MFQFSYFNAVWRSLETELSFDGESSHTAVGTGQSLAGLKQFKSNKPLVKGAVPHGLIESA